MQELLPDEAVGTASVRGPAGGGEGAPAGPADGEAAREAAREARELARGAVDDLPDGALAERLRAARAEGRPLRVKLGIDPTGRPRAR